MNRFLAEQQIQQAMKAAVKLNKVLKAISMKPSIKKKEDIFICELGVTCPALFLCVFYIYPSYSIATNVFTEI